MSIGMNLKLNRDMRKETSLKIDGIIKKIESITGLKNLNKYKRNAYDEACELEKESTFNYYNGDLKFIVCNKKFLDITTCELETYRITSAGQPTIFELIAYIICYNLNTTLQDVRLLTNIK
jgi:hypothetical protein